LVQTLTVNLGARSYPIHVGSKLLRNADLLAPHLPYKRAALISNETVFPLYGAGLLEDLARSGVEAVPVIVPDGESYKTWETLDRIFDVLLSHAFDRKSTLIALGGGVIGDLAGFAAATYQRGVPYIQIPTTLLAQVDSSIGGKTAVNHARGKNMIGAFYQPKLVLADTGTLKTLPERELRAGLAEVIKYGLIRDAEFFAWLEAHLDNLLARDVDALTHAIMRSCENKVAVVAADEREQGERALLNFGHTFGHAIETALGYGKWLHGEAVAVGMVMAARLSRERGRCAEADLQRTVAILERAGLPVQAPSIAAEHMLELMQLDKKNESGQIRLILLNRIGEAFVEPSVARALLLDFLGRVNAP
jgi:3-dehydroquinate synthase